MTPLRLADSERRTAISAASRLPVPPGFAIYAVTDDGTTTCIEGRKARRAPPITAESLRNGDGRPFAVSLAYPGLLGRIRHGSFLQGPAG